jgi:hypothetical protein
MSGQSQESEQWIGISEGDPAKLKDAFQDFADKLPADQRDKFIPVVIEVKVGNPNVKEFKVSSGGT